MRTLDIVDAKQDVFGVFPCSFLKRSFSNEQSDIGSLLLEVKCWILALFLILLLAFSRIHWLTFDSSAVKVAAVAVNHTYL